MVFTITDAAQHGTRPTKDLFSRVSVNNVKSPGKLRKQYNKSNCRDTGDRGLLAVERCLVNSPV